MKTYFFTVKLWFSPEQGYAVRAESPHEAWEKVLIDHNPAELTSVVLFDIRSQE